MDKAYGRGSADRGAERGAARAKFIIVFAVIAVIAYMGYQYVPVAYNAYLYKDLMQTNATKAVEGQIPVEQKAGWVKSQLQASAKDYGVPPDAKITPLMRDGRMEVTVQFTRPINLLPGFTYQYNFEHTVKSTALFDTK
ncbi:MAG TPA: hypothetical protein VF723_02225 [Pyrinomonadaceae bacterium]|jgi:hypothetical protein